MRVLVAVVIALNSIAAMAQLYSWKDADGKVHYSDEPPPAAKTPVRKLTAQPAPTPPAAAPEPKNDGADAANKPKTETPPKALDPAEVERRRAGCEKARGNLQALESGAVRFGVSPQGERVALDGARRQAELDSARQAVEGWCK